MQLNLLPTVQQAITNLLTVYEPEFLRFGYGLFLSFATILIVWQGIRMMFSHDGLGDQMFEFAKLLMLISFGYAMITFYEAPIPGFGVSFSNLITDQAGYFQSVLEARAFDNIYRHFDELADHFMQPDAWSILANLIYWTVLLLVALAKALSLAVIAFGLIASAVCGLLGPIFVPFFVVPKLEWLFWGWLKSFIQYSFIPVVAIAFLMIFEQFVFRYVTTLPPTITSAEYGVYALQAVAVIATFCVGMVMVPSLTNSIFSGHGGADHDFVRSADPSAAVARGGDMPRRFSNVPDHLREPHEVEIQGFWNIYFVAIGIVILFGLVSGTLYIAWQLLSARLGQ